MNREYLRAWLEIDGLRICRDITLKDGSFQPQHCKHITDSGLLEWGNHEEGGLVPVVTIVPDYS